MSFLDLSPNICIYSIFVMLFLSLHSNVCALAFSITNTTAPIKTKPITSADTSIAASATNSTINALTSAAQIENSTSSAWLQRSNQENSSNSTSTSRSTTREWTRAACSRNGWMCSSSEKCSQKVCKLKNGYSCKNHGDCLSNVCSHGACLALSLDAPCNHRFACSSTWCISTCKAAPGSLCSAHTACMSNCTLSQTSSRDDCVFACSQHDNCVGTCRDGICQHRALGESCTHWQQCGHHPSCLGNRCLIQLGRACEDSPGTPSFCWGDNFVQGECKKLPLGGNCTDSGFCFSDICDSGVCVTTTTTTSTTSTTDTTTTSSSTTTSTSTTTNTSTTTTTTTSWTSTTKMTMSSTIEITRTSTTPTTTNPNTRKNSSTSSTTASPTTTTTTTSGTNTITTRTSTTATTVIACRTTITTTIAPSATLATITSTTHSLPPTVLYGSLTIEVTNATLFVEDPEVAEALRSAIAEMAGVERSWIHNISLRLKSSASDNQRLLEESDPVRMEVRGGVIVDFRIVVPPDSSESDIVLATVIFEKLDRQTLEEVSEIIDRVVKSGVLGNSYDAKVIHKFVGVRVESSDPQDPHKESSADESDTLTIILAVVVGVAACTIWICVLVAVARYWRSSFDETRQEPRSGGVARGSLEYSAFLAAAGPLAACALHELLSPPPAITYNNRNDLRRLLSAMASNFSADDEIDAFISYAPGQRCEDAFDSGPGLYYAAAVLKAFHAQGIECALRLPGVLEEDSLLKLIQERQGNKLLFVIETGALLDSRACLTEIYTALISSFVIHRIIFENSSAHRTKHWAQICNEDVMGATMRAAVEHMYFACPCSPCPPRTALEVDCLHPLAVDTYVTVNLDRARQLERAICNKINDTSGGSHNAEMVASAGSTHSISQETVRNEPSLQSSLPSYVGAVSSDDTIVTPPGSLAKQVSDVRPKSLKRSNTLPTEPEDGTKAGPLQRSSTLPVEALASKRGHIRDTLPNQMHTMKKRSKVTKRSTVARVGKRQTEQTSMLLELPTQTLPIVESELSNGTNSESCRGGKMARLASKELVSRLDSEKSAKGYKKKPQVDRTREKSSRTIGRASQPAYFSL